MYHSTAYFIRINEDVISWQKEVTQKNFIITKTEGKTSQREEAIHIFTKYSS